jgi:hypothetical protein
MAQDFLSQLFGGQPDYSQFMTPQQSEQSQTNALTSAGLNAAIALLGASGQTNRPISTGQALGSALSAGLGGYQSSFDNQLRQMLAQGKLADIQQNRQLTEQTLAANRLKMERNQQYQDLVSKVFVPTPVQVPMSREQGSQLEMLSRPEFGGDMAVPETMQALQQNLPTTQKLDMNALIQALASTGPEGLTKAATLLQPKEVKDTRSAKVKDFEYAVEQGYTGSFTDFIKSGVPSTNIMVSNEKTYGGAFAGKIADLDVTKYDVATRAPVVLDQVNRTRKILDSGNVFVGSLANPKLELARFGQEIGVVGKDTDELVANTQTLMASRAQATLDSIKASGLGSGQGFTDKDRIFLENARLGNITYSKKAIQDQLDIEEKIARASTQAWNDRYDQIPKSAKEPLGLQKITLPSSADLGNTKVKKYNPSTGKAE